MNPDPLDQATDVAQEMVDREVALIRSHVGPERKPGADGQYDPYCEDCGLELEPARRDAGRCRCIRCQSVLERRAKGYGA